MGAEHDGGSIGLAQATSIGIGGMVGGGIFAVLGVAASKAGGATPLAFAIGGVIAALTATSYSRLSVRHPSGGGTVDILDRVLGIETLTGSLNIVLWAGYIATLALYASAFANYAAALVTGGGPGPVMFRVLVVVGLSIPWLINLTNAALVDQDRRNGRGDQDDDPARGDRGRHARDLDRRSSDLPTGRGSGRCSPQPC